MWGHKKVPATVQILLKAPLIFLAKYVWGLWEKSISQPTFSKCLFYLLFFEKKRKEVCIKMKSKHFDDVFLADFSLGNTV